MTQKVVLLFGGKSDERFVSVASAQNIANYNIFTERWFIDINGAISKIDQQELIAHKNPFENPFIHKQKPFSPNILMSLPYLQDAVVFIGLHGTEGEDGTIQKIFETNQIKFTGSGSKSSAECFNKILTKEKVSRKSIKTAHHESICVNSKNNFREKIKSFFHRHGNCIIKPVANGSSFGLHIIKDPEGLEKAIANLLNVNSLPSDYMMEEYITGREITVGVINFQGKIIALPPSEVIVEKGFSFDYKGKYLGRGSLEVTPANLSENEISALQQVSIIAHQTLDCFGYSRTDFIFTNEGPVFLETNTLPGLTKASFIPQQLQAADINFQDFLLEQVELAGKRHEKISIGAQEGT